MDPIFHIAHNEFLDELRNARVSIGAPLVKLQKHIIGCVDALCEIEELENRIKNAVIKYEHNNGLKK